MLPHLPVASYIRPIMDTVAHSPSRRGGARRAPFAWTRIAAIGLVAGIPLGASSAQTLPLTTTAPAPIEAAGEANDAIPFAAHFTEVVEPLGPELQHMELAVPATAVDLDTFEPPVEDPILRSLGIGTASYYGRRFHGRRTANGERFDMRALTAAHKTLPFGSLVRVTNPRNGRSVTVRINDRGPFTRGREIDLSRAAAEEIGMIARGHGRVEMELLAR
ncbi:septal ring lytic transglycosylase RlpA family protein [Erythrobacter sp.]|uniref:septal ring lytic transglycosylase RlpA family protein n=1 Tax=Erythrobacter sp. TaxID=1042 RepID=UPI002E9F4B7E|nr:septal ring lytic transglycosylase RlpA family protein [Erythrobacter sp.]